MATANSSNPASSNPALNPEQIGAALNQFGQFLSQRDAAHQTALNQLASAIAQRDGLHQQSFESLAKLAKDVSDNLARSATGASSALGDIQQTLSSLESRVGALEKKS
jgi:ABC-type transporter Mla subunit MlaD